MQCAVQILYCFPIENVILLCIGFINWRFSCVQMERGCHGLERIDVNKFPIKKYSDKYFAAAENSQYVHLFLLFLSNLFLMLVK